MQPAQALQTALALFSGKAGPPWATRAARVTSLLGKVAGDDPPDLPLIPPDRAEPLAYPRLTPTVTARAAAVEAAENLADAVARRRFDRLEGLLHETVWVLWPNGALGRHARQDICAHLGARSGSRASLKIREKRSYTFAELKSALARGLPEMIDALLAAQSAVIVTLDVGTRDGHLGRLLFAMSADAGGNWRARNLPFGSPDDAHAASIRPSGIEDEVARVPDRIVRNVVLGQSALLRANRNDLMERFWLKDGLVPADQLATTIGAGPHRLGSTEVVFLGSSEVSFRELRAHAPPAFVEELRRRAPDVLGRALERLDPRLVVTELGTLDPAGGDVTPARKAASVVIHVEDRARDERRPRIAALFI